MQTKQREQLAEASNVLLLGSMLDDSTKRTHNALLSQELTERTDVLALTFQSPGQWLRTWTGTPETHDGRITVITLDESPYQSTQRTDDVTSITVNPADLTGIGMKVSDYLSSQVKTDAETVVCFDSITGLLQYTNQKSLFRFLRVITRRIEHVDGIAHFHLDPDAHDRKTISTIKTPFDAIVQPDTAGGGVTVSTRY
ncbi:DUF7504 family protein [Natrinema ejinorense]|uniref:KaiC-like domain-containing protein n=1 Tax=Natrinema ejinorense TaxID=373386 RepID=A0A2A5QX96_9EURY|nr:hypothetical protein [Natrinema ejinorense]PCR91451.1 hypothetical protein CP557_13495 [Natrinema ejinorense]